MSRPRNIVPSTEWWISLPSDLAAQIELLLTDPLRAKPKLGARSKLVEKLLRDWLEKRKAEIRSGADISSV